MNQNPEPQAASTSASAEAPTADEIFEPYYKAVSGTVIATGHPEKFRWKGGPPFPYEEASWPGFRRTCSEGSKLKMSADTYVGQIGEGPRHPEYKQQTQKVRAYWESQGWKVRTSGAAEGYEEIAVDLEHGITVVYNSGLGGEAVRAETPCSAVFDADQAKAKKVKGAGVK